MNLRHIGLGLSALAPVSGLACAACYGQSDAPMAAGMNWGILSLLGVIVAVLGGIAGFFIYLAKRSAALAAAELAAPRLEATENEFLSERPAPAFKAPAVERGQLKTSVFKLRRRACAQSHSQTGSGRAVGRGRD